MYLVKCSIPVDENYVDFATGKPNMATKFAVIHKVEDIALLNGSKYPNPEIVGHIRDVFVVINTKSSPTKDGFHLMTTKISHTSADGQLIYTEEKEPYFGYNAFHVNDIVSIAEMQCDIKTYSGLNSLLGSVVWEQHYNSMGDKDQRMVIEPQPFCTQRGAYQISLTLRANTKRPAYGSFSMNVVEMETLGNFLIEQAKKIREASK
jgi:hypothetical protein